MKSVLSIMIFIWSLSFSAFAAQEVIQTTEAVLETPCIECEENLEETTQAQLEEAEEVTKTAEIQVTGLHFTTSKVDEFDGEITVEVINYDTSEKNTYVLSNDNNYTLDTGYSTKNIQVIPSLSKQYNYNYYSNVIISEPCRKGIIEVNVVIDYKLIDTEQEDGAFETDENYNAYTSKLDRVETDFGLSKNTRSKVKNNAVEEQIKEYESNIVEDIASNSNAVTDEYMSGVHSLFIIIIGVVLLGAAGILTYIVIWIKKIKEDD